MSDADAGANEDPDMTTVTLKIPQAFLDDLDATWRAEDFPSRSEFMRWTLRDAVKHPTFSRKGGRTSPSANTSWRLERRKPTVATRSGRV